MAVTQIPSKFMPIEEFVRRAHQAKLRGDVPVLKQMKLEVPYSRSFDTFAANAAYAIRGEVVYRSDGGVFARGFVRQTGDLLDIHQQLLATDLRDGAKILMDARFYRRQDAKASMRWAMSIRFYITGIYTEEDNNTITFTEDEGETTAARPEVMDNLEKQLMDDIISAISNYANGQVLHKGKWPVSDRAKRLQDWVTLALWTGYPACTKLWFYSRRPAWLYVRWETKQSERQSMTRATNGRVPFDGETGAPEHLTWRRYPFRELMDKCRGLDPDHRQALAAETMRLAEEDIFDCISDLNRELRRLTPAGNTDYHGNPLTTGATSVMAAEADAFVRHFVGLLKDKNTLYATYMKYSQSWTWIDTFSGYH